MYLYFTSILFALLTYFLWNYTSSKYIVVSMNTRSNIKVHTHPISYINARKKESILKEQYNNQTLSGYSCKSQVFLLKFNPI